MEVEILMQIFYTLIEAMQRKKAKQNNFFVYVDNIRWLVPLQGERVGLSLV